MLPATIIILPIDDGSVDLVQKQLKDLCPEVILFLSSVRVLQVLNKTVKWKFKTVKRKLKNVKRKFKTVKKENASDSLSDSEEFMGVTRSEALSAIESRVCKFYKVTLRLETAKDTITYYYLIFQHRFPIPTSFEERQDIREWIITLAFPQQKRASFGEVGEVFSFLPMDLKTGFPFILNADFILISSRKIQLDNAWNVGILKCIPMAFHIAFEILLRKPVSKSIRAIGITEKWCDRSKHRLRYADIYRNLRYIALATFSEVSLGTELLYASSEDDSQWSVEWMKEFSLWDSSKVMPAGTSKALGEATNSAELKAWIKKHGSLADLTAQKYSETLIEKLKVITVKSEQFQSTGIFPILVMQFLYSGIRAGYLDWRETVDTIRTGQNLYSRSIEFAGILRQPQAERRGWCTSATESEQVVTPFPQSSR